MTEQTAQTEKAQEKKTPQPEKVEKTKKAKQNQNRQRQAPPSRAEIKREIELSSYFTQQVMQRSITKLPQYLFSLAVIIPAVADHNDDVIAAALQSVDNKINAFSHDLDVALKTLEALSEEWGITSLATHTNPTKYSLAITTPHYGRMIQAMLNLDRFFCLAETLYLHGAIQDVTEYWEQLKGWRLRGNQTVSEIIQIENRARSAASKKGKVEALEQANSGVAKEGILSATDQNGNVSDINSLTAAEAENEDEVYSEQGNDMDESQREEKASMSS